MTQLRQDIRYAIRTLLANPLLSGVALLTLALGIGASTAVFSVVNAVLLEPLPYQNPERLALIWTEFGSDLPQNWISGPEFVEMREFQSAFEDIAVVVPFTATITGLGEPEEVGAAGVSVAFFDVLGVKAAAGRLMEAADEDPASDAVFLRHGYWQSSFGGDPRAVGRTFNLSGFPVTVAGVLPADFEILHPDAQFPRDVDVWVPLPGVLQAVFGAGRYQELPRGSHFMRGFARMKPGVTPAQAQADMTAVAARIQEKTPDYYDFEGWGIKVISLHDDLVEEVRPALLVLMGAVLFVLLIACVNVANLLLTRAVGREREIALRTTLGATRWRLTRQLLTESLVLALAGGAAAVTLAYGLIRALAWVAPADLPRAAEVSLDWSVLSFALLLCLSAGLLFGLFPAVHAWKEDLVESLKEGGRGSSGGRRGRRFRTALVVAETALALILLAGAGLMIKSFSQLTEADPGYRSQGVLTFLVNLPQVRYSQPEQVRSFYDRLRERLESVPGVISAGAISHLPLSGSASSGTTRVRRSETVPEDRRAGEIDRRVVTPGYFETMGTRLRQGRYFLESDHAEAPLVAIVDQEFVNRFWPDEDPLGQHVSINFGGDPMWREVVGVIDHQRHQSLDRVGRGQVYFPLEQQPNNRMYLSVRTSLDPSELAPVVRGTVLEIDPDQPISDVQAMSSRTAASLSGPRFTLLLLGAFAVLALVLAAVGIYGVLSYSTQSRRGEIGVRMALGADSRAVRGLVLRQGLLLVGLGLLLGLPAALGLSRFLESLLYHVEPTDPAIYASVGGVLLLAALLACYLPARRATRVDPVEVLHSE